MQNVIRFTQYLSHIGAWHSPINPKSLLGAHAVLGLAALGDLVALGLQLQQDPRPMPFEGQGGPMPILPKSLLGALPALPALALGHEPALAIPLQPCIPPGLMPFPVLASAVACSGL